MIVLKSSSVCSRKGLCTRTPAALKRISTLRLDVFCGNPFALALYRGSFYEEVGIARWRKGEFFLMEKYL